MLRPAFADDDFPIRWLLHEDDATSRCRVTEYLDGLPAQQRDKVFARMKEWAKFGNWNVRVGFIKQLDAGPAVAMYEVKSHQDRVLFVRRGMDAIAVDAMQKKNDWSKKDQRTLDAAVEIAKDALGQQTRRS